MNKKGGLVLSVIILVAVFTAGLLVGTKFVKLQLSPQLPRGVFGLPDLEANFGPGGGDCGPPGCRLYLFGEITNIGAIEAKNFYVTFTDITGDASDNDITILEAFISNLPPQESIILNATYGYITEGTYTIKLEADSTNVVNELNESNNIDIVTLNVPPF